MVIRSNTVFVLFVDFCCFRWILSSVWECAFSLFYSVCTVCLGLFARPLGVIDRLCSVFEALLKHLIYHSSRKHAYSNILKILPPKK